MIINKGICSVSFRFLSPEQIVNLLKENNLNCVEWGGDVHVPVTDFENAERVKKLTLENELQILTFGSYYKCEDVESFENVSKTAEILGAKVIRIWAGKQDAEKFTDEEFNNLVSIVKKCADIASTRNQIIAFEFHFGTYNNCPENSLKLLNAINKENVKTYWQPMYWKQYTDKETEININVDSIKKLYEKIVCVHVYHWKGFDRFDLSEGVDYWNAYFKVLPSVPAYLEFFKNDNVDQFKKDNLSFLKF